MTTHDYAQKLRTMAAFIESRPCVDIKDAPAMKVWWNFYEKERFLAAAKAMGSGTKRIDTVGVKEFVFTPNTPEGIKLELCIARDRVCEKVQEEKWECKALLSEAEVAEIGGQ
ncbi:MAG TPA: hypothetical protein VKY85_01365 [Candidatus Angelobacter sp.]|nr:hypothetical protein [Candidatus Angelobacter sp.]